MGYKKKLIEVALPLEAINEASVREKSIRHGHPSTLHLWWARRPLAVVRAVIFASLVDDPSSHPELFPTVEKQEEERKNLHKLIGELIQWENSNNEEVLNKAKAEILKYTDGKLPALLDPFAGGGTIPLEAQRLGLETYAMDLNPVAVMINKAMIEIPPKLAGQPPVNPEAKRRTDYHREWKGATGLAEDVRYYGQWMKNKAFERIGHLYPKVKDEYGKEHTVIAWIWARTVKCPNPACGCEIPLANSFVLSRKKGKEAYIQPIIEGKKICYEVRYGKNAPEPPKTARGRFRCICCNSPIDGEYIKAEGHAKRIGSSLMAIVAEGKNGRLYLSPSEEHIQIANCCQPEWKPEIEMNQNCTDLISGRGYGFKYWYELFTNRQLIALNTLCDLVGKAQKKATEDALSAGISNDETPLCEGGTGAIAYGQAVGIYLAFLVDKQAMYLSSFCPWDVSRDRFVHVFGRQAIPMVWDFAEGNLFSSSSGSFGNMIEWVVKCLNNIPVNVFNGIVKQHDARIDNELRNVMISTDPPYYDMIGYADLSDFFYIWLRKMLNSTYPELFNTILVPKTEELVATPYRFDGNKNDARIFYEDGMLKTFKQIFTYAREDIPITVYYAYKQCDEEYNKGTSGWETILSAIMQAEFSITGTWPLRTELTTALKGNENALASSIVLVCRKRPANAPICTRRDFINALKRELKPALQQLQSSNIAPVDLAQSAIGPGMSVFSRYSKVLEADGTPMSVRAALQIINQELDLYFNEQDVDLDRDSRFCVELYSQYAYNDVDFGEADVLARAKNTSVEKLARRGVLYAQKGVVRLLTREEIPEKINKGIIWLFTQQLTRALEKEGVEGVAKIIVTLLTSEPEQAKALAYRLYTIADRKNWAAEAYVYNSLVNMWPAILSKAAELQDQIKDSQQLTLSFDIKES
ncbi:MAG: DUF1156 domain-containing protein [Firmicutes bacterium]|nr:DUF1156 domain-containing protein [Bacillota bacterium]